MGHQIAHKRKPQRHRSTNGGTSQKNTQLHSAKLHLSQPRHLHQSNNRTAHWRDMRTEMGGHRHRQWHHRCETNHRTHLYRRGKPQTHRAHYQHPKNQKRPS